MDDLGVPPLLNPPDIPSRFSSSKSFPIGFENTKKKFSNLQASMETVATGKPKHFLFQVI